MKLIILILLVVVGQNGSVNAGDYLSEQVKKRRKEKFTRVSSNDLLKQILVEQHEAKKNQLLMYGCPEPGIKKMTRGELILCLEAHLITWKKNAAACHSDCNEKSHQSRPIHEEDLLIDLDNENDAGTLSNNLKLLNRLYSLGNTLAIDAKEGEPHSWAKMYVDKLDEKGLESLQERLESFQRSDVETE